MDRAILIRTQEPRQEDCFNLLVLSVGNQVSSVAIDRKDTEKDVIVLLPAAIEFDDEEESKISTHRTIWMLVLLVCLPTSTRSNTDHYIPLYCRILFLFGSFPIFLFFFPMVLLGVSMQRVRGRELRV
jgi:hypothetical protein